MTRTEAWLPAKRNQAQFLTFFLRTTTPPSSSFAGHGSHGSTLIRTRGMELMSGTSGAANALSSSLSVTPLSLAEDFSSVTAAFTELSSRPSSSWWWCPLLRSTASDGRAFSTDSELCPLSRELLMSAAGFEAWSAALRLGGRGTEEVVEEEEMEESVTFVRSSSALPEPDEFSCSDDALLGR